jgi:hypothetical protein
MPRTLMALTLIGLLGCSGRGERPPYATAQYNVGTGGSSYNVTNTDSCGPPVSDAGLCGNQVLPTQENRPNLYFVVDASGSMGDNFDAVTPKYTAAVDAIVNVLEIIGHRVSYGAAIFPVGNTSGGDGCGLPGSEIFKTQPGDSVICSINGKMGDVLTNFQSALSPRIRKPNGGTPLSATLTNLEPTLKSLPGKTAVILATDGAPNCNPNASCDASFCELNLDGDSLNGTLCAAPVNCCDPTLFPGGQTSCVDNVATNAALAELNSAGISTYVIGLPGIEPTLAAVLDSMAVAGGTARSGYPRYYEVDDTQSLADALRTIATQIAVSCTIALTSAPPNWAQVNVYLDSEEVPNDPDNGWTQIDNQTLEIAGTYCATLQAGNVFQVQITAGCPTYVL